MLNIENIFPERGCESAQHAGMVGSCSTDRVKNDAAGRSLPAWVDAVSAIKHQHILLPFDFSAASVQLFRCLGSLVGGWGARLTVVHIVSPGASPDSGAELHPGERNEERVKTRRALLERLLSGVHPGPGALSAHVVVGEPTEQILQLARGAKPDVIAMATHGPRVLKHLLISATTERIARQAECPVLVVPEAVLTGRERLGRQNVCAGKPRIVVPTDLSANSAAALRFAQLLAKARKAELHVVNFCGEQSAQAPSSRARLEQWVRAHLPSSDFVTTTLCEQEPSVYLLIKRAEWIKADLIVLGPRGYAWAERFRLNSTTDGILRNAPCPVVSLRAGTRLARH